MLDTMKRVLRRIRHDRTGAARRRQIARAMEMGPSDPDEFWPDSDLPTWDELEETAKRWFAEAATTAVAAEQLDQLDQLALERFGLEPEEALRHLSSRIAKMEDGVAYRAKLLVALRLEPGASDEMMLMSAEAGREAFEALESSETRFSRVSKMARELGLVKEGCTDLQLEERIQHALSRLAAQGGAVLPFGLRLDSWDKLDRAGYPESIWIEQETDDESSMVKYWNSRVLAREFHERQAMRRAFAPDDAEPAGADLGPTPPLIDFVEVEPAANCDSPTPEDMDTRPLQVDVDDQGMPVYIDTDCGFCGAPQNSTHSFDCAVGGGVS